MNNNKFFFAGIISIAAGVIFPIAFVVQGVSSYFFDSGPVELAVGVGASNFLFLIFAALGIFAMYHLKQLLFEQFSFKKLNTLISLNIFWFIVFFYVGSFIAELLLIPWAESNDLGLAIMTTIPYMMAIAIFGVLDILIGAILLKHKKELKSSIEIFAYLSIMVGVAEITVILLPFNLIFVPLYFFLLSYVFFQKIEEVKIV